jgi:predicted nucleotidyltransferase
MLEKLLSSRVRAKILGEFFISPGVSHHAWELKNSLDEAYSAIWKELNRLESLGILISGESGKTKNYKVNPTCPIAPELRSIILKTTGIGLVIRNHLEDFNGIRAAFIFGSFATGEADERSDLDLMVIGNVNLEQFSIIISQVEKHLSRPINYAIFSSAEWDEKVIQQDPFILNVKQAPKIMLVGFENAV